MTVKKAFNFEIEASSPYYINTQKRKKSKIWFFLFFPLTVAIIVVVTQGMNALPVLQSEDESGQVVKTIALPNMEHKRLSESHIRSEQEVQNLLNQEYIDPLTQYIEKYRRNKKKSHHVQEIIAERDRRCAEIEKLYHQRQKNYVTLARLRKGYNYSCPDVVTKFAKSLQQAQKNKISKSAPVELTENADYL